MNQVNLGENCMDRILALKANLRSRNITQWKNVYLMLEETSMEIINVVIN